MRRRNKKVSSKIYVLIIIVIAILSYIGIDFKSIFNQTSVHVVNMDTLENLTIKTCEKITKELVSENTQNLKVYFFNVGQADSILIMNQDETMLIDAGNNEDGSLLVNNLKTLNIEKIDYLIGTHPHEDHIGGMDDIIQNFEIGTIYMPKVQANTKTFEDVLDKVAEKQLKISTPNVNEIFFIGKAECKVLAVGDNYTNLNLSSIVVQMNFDKLSYLFMGDAEKEIEQNIKVEKINILKVGHHGSDTSSNEKFLKKIKPELAIISVGKDNSYGHPSQTVLNRFETIGSKIFRTDEAGNIMLEHSFFNDEKSFIKVEKIYCKNF